jgi:agmatine deiminase
MPGEFTPHAGCWMLWPQRPDNWRQEAKPAQKAFAAVAAAIASAEPLSMGVSADHFSRARNLLPPEVKLVEIASDDAWVRDSGPTFVTRSGAPLRAVHWEFNAWGGHHDGLYTPWEQDRLVAARIAEVAGVDLYKSDFVMEGGSFHVDGRGTLMTTAECLLSPGRNPSFSKAEIEAHLSDYLGVQKIIWIPRGVFLDETNGHIDNLACFIRPGVVALTWTDDRADPQYERSAEAFELLSTTTDAQGRRLEVHKIHQPDPLSMTADEAAGLATPIGAKPRHGGDRLAASYVNFYIGNGVVVMPAFDCAQDEPAARQLAALFPDRRIIPVPSREILLGGGNIHCITQQQPVGSGG